MIFRYLFLASLCLWWTSPLFAETSTGTRDLVNATLNQKALSTPQGRLTLARAVNGYCKEVQAVYPRNSPSEDRWLDSEISGDGERPRKALSSAELGRRVAKNFTDSCVTSSDWAIKKPDTAIYFVILAHDFIRFSADAAFYAKLNGVNHAQFWFEGMPRNAAEALTLSAIIIETDRANP